MAKILCVTSSLLGLLYPALELCRRLERDGHQLTYAGFPQVRTTVESQEVEFLPLEPSRYDTFRTADAKASTLSRLRHLSSRRQRAVESLALDRWRQVLRQADPELILIDCEMHEQILAAWPSQRPMALLTAFVSIWRRPGLPPPHRLARPGVGWKGSRLGTSLLWSELRLRKWRKAATQKVRHLGCDRLSLLRRLADDSGLDLRRETDSGQWLIPFTYRNLPVLSLRALEFDFHHQPPDGVHYVGPMLLESRGDERLPEAETDRLDAVFESSRGAGRRLIYAGFGSFFSTDLPFVRRLIDAVAERDDWELVISLGGQMTPAELGPLPPHVHAFGWLPQVEVLRHAAVAIIHGGINTVDECVLSGVPMLVYCGFATDMGGTTARVVHHGLGVAGDRRRDGPQAIRGRIEQLLEEPRFTENVERLRRLYHAYSENRVAERAVAGLLERAGAEL